MISEIEVARALELTTTYSVNDHSTIVNMQATTERRFTLKRLRDMIITYRQMHHILIAQPNHLKLVWVYS